MPRFTPRIGNPKDCLNCLPLGLHHGYSRCRVPGFPLAPGILPCLLLRQYLSGSYRGGCSEHGKQKGFSVMKIGTTIRAHRLQKGLSQGDIEKKTGLLRCYLSRVENGHTVPSLDTLSKIALALDLPIAQFFAEDTLNGNMNGHHLSDEELRFLTQIRRYSTNLNDSDRKLLLAMVKKFASTAVAR